MGVRRGMNVLRLRILGVVSLLFCLNPNGWATIRTVCSSGCDFTTIGAAFSAAINGDTIEIQDDGVYNETFSNWNKPVVLKSAPGFKATISRTSTAPDTPRLFLVTADFCRFEDLILDGVAFGDPNPKVMRLG